MPPVGTAPKNKTYVSWSKVRRFEKGAQLVVHDGWTQTEAAAEVGVSRPRLAEKVKALKLVMDEKVRVAKMEILTTDTLKAAVGPLGLQEERRVGTFWEFSDRYWNRWMCPDCQVHHPDPSFHQEIINDVLEDPKVLRGVINMPPYHSKSTLITVKHTIYKITKNPNWRRIIVSASLNFAQDFLYSIQNLLTNPSLYEDGPSLIDDWGPFKTDDTPWSARRLFVAGRQSAEKDPTVEALGYGGQVYGKRADDIVFDDIATLDNQTNPEAVIKMMRKIDQEYLSRIGKTSPAYFVGTRVAHGDIYSVLQRRNGYKILKYPCVLDDVSEQTLWPDHFGYHHAIVRKEEMINRDWQLVYQNHDAPGEGAAFNEAAIDDCKDTKRLTGMYENGWILVGGLDLAGGTKDSGFTCGILMGVDLQTGKRYLIDHFNQKGMRSPVLKDKLLAWCDSYPVYEIRVENNGLQGQLVQYDTELIKKLALQGTRVVGHHTQTNKWDPKFGVESMAVPYGAGLYSIPWGNIQAQRKWRPLVDQLLMFPGTPTDMVMANWFADLGVRDRLKRAHLPMFDEKATKRWPNRIKGKRQIIDFASRTGRKVEEYEQIGSQMTTSGASNYRRLMVGRPTKHEELEDPGPIVNPWETNRIMSGRGNAPFESPTDAEIGEYSE